MKNHLRLVERMLRIFACVLALSFTSAGSAWSNSEEPPARFIVTHEGERIELKGDFEERGNRVVFKDKQGRLRSMPKSAVDFEATRAAGTTEPAEESKSERKASPRRPVLVLDQSNTKSFEKSAPPAVTTTEPVRKTTSSKAGSAPGSGGDPESSSGAEAPPGGDSSSLEVLSWDDQGSEDDDEAGTDIWGSIKNTGGIAATQIKVEVRLVSGQGTLLANETVDTFETTLKPGEVTNFNVSWEERVFYDDVEFEVSYLEARGQAPRPPAPDR